MARILLASGAVLLLLAGGAELRGAAGDASQTHVLMINGGGSPRANYRSHLLHVQQLHALLLESGVSPGRITIASADGSDPAADMAVRDLQPERDFWRLSGTRLERVFRTRIGYENSVIGGVTLLPATRESLRAWFETASRRLASGDTLLLYVTDHGTRDPEDPSNNRITLWGEDQHLSVTELRELLSLLKPEVRVVALMSQCFSGAFADLMYAQDGLPGGNFSGFFSSTADRRAYGCYPENRDRDNVGHSFRFIEALRQSPSLDRAHDRVLVSDRTPDVPLRTSDLYLQRVLQTEAQRTGEPFEALADRLLGQAWRDKEAWAPQIRLLDRMGEAFGYFSPRFLSELSEQEEGLSDVSRQFADYRNAWRAALQSLNRENLARFLADHPERARQVSKEALAALSAEGRRRLARGLLGELADHTGADLERAGRLNLLRGNAEATREASYRMQVRRAVVLRMRFTLIGVAGRVFLAQGATASQRAAYEELIRGEAFALPVSPRPPSFLLAGAPFPSFEEDLRLAKAALPGWIGIRFQPVASARRQRLQFESGAVSVVAVYPDSPAEEAGLQQGDIVLGLPGQPFVERDRIRELIMTAPLGQPVRLEVQRGEDRVDLSLIPRAYPRQWPKLPGPPKVGSSAPPLNELQAFRGDLPGDPSWPGPHLLFFWATWCRPCKAALPEVTAFEQQRGIPVIAITDEPSAKLETFFRGYRGPFPDLVAMDEFRHSFIAYGVSGTPSFVLIDAEGRVESISTGYRVSEGLRIAGWHWARPDSGSKQE